MRPPIRPEPLRQRLGLGLLWLVGAAAASAGCSTGLEVRQLATGRVDTEAFELRGPDLDQLRREALRRCPMGAEVLRQAARDQRPAITGEEGRIERWTSRLAAWVDPPQREAQLLVACKVNAQLQMLMPAPMADPDARTAPVLLPSPDAQADVPPPIGPILPEW